MQLKITLNIWVKSFSPKGVFVDIDVSYDGKGGLGEEEGAFSNNCPSEVLLGNPILDSFLPSSWIICNLTSLEAIDVFFIKIDQTMHIPRISYPFHSKLKMEQK